MHSKLDHGSSRKHQLCITLSLSNKRYPYLLLPSLTPTFLMPTIIPLWVAASEQALQKPIRYVHTKTRSTTSLIIVISSKGFPQAMEQELKLNFIITIQIPKLLPIMLLSQKNMDPFPNKIINTYLLLSNNPGKMLIITIYIRTHTLITLI